MALRASRGETFPVGTLVVNVIGSFVISFFAQFAGPDGPLLVSSLTRQVVMIGILGGFTTFSSFSFQTLNLLQDGQWARASANIGLSLVHCLFAVWLGHIAAREHHLAGATVLKSPLGFGKTSRLHTAKILQLSTDLPLVIEIVGLSEKIEAFLPILATLEKVQVIHYESHNAGTN